MVVRYRRAFITRMYRAGNEEKVIARLMGTKSLPEFRKYQQVSADDIMLVKNKRVGAELIAGYVPKYKVTSAHVARKTFISHPLPAV